MFFDLVFVFAVTQISHSLLAHLTPLGLAQTVLVLLAVWWLWIYTTWTTNWLDPDRTPVRLMLLALMLGGLVLSSSIPEAFGERGLVFAVALSAMHLGRTLFVLYAFLRNGRREQQHNFVRIFAWQCAAAALWIAGGLATPELRPWRSNTWRRCSSSGCPAWGVRRPARGTSTARTWPSAACCS